MSVVEIGFAEATQDQLLRLEHVDAVDDGDRTDGLFAEISLVTSLLYLLRRLYEVQKTASSRYVVPRPEDPTQKANLEEWAKKCTLFAVAEEKETGKYVGDVYLRIDRPKDQDAEVGIVVSRKSWGKGYGTEMMR